MPSPFRHHRPTLAPHASRSPTSSREYASRAGFTLLEFLLAITIFSILITISIIISFNAIARTNLRSSESVLVQMIRRAQVQSQQNVDGETWGVQLVDSSGTKTIVLFVGDSYATRDVAKDVSFPINKNIAFGGTLYNAMVEDTASPNDPTGLVFKRFTGAPVDDSFFSAPTDGMLTLTMYGSVRRLRVNRQGVVERM